MPTRPVTQQQQPTARKNLKIEENLTKRGMSEIANL
jgi:hypothetical protein